MDRRDFLIQAAQVGVALTASGKPESAPRPAPGQNPKPGGTMVADWTVYRHDTALTGVSPGKGRILQPEVLWEYYLGAPFVSLATDRIPQPSNVADLDGDGKP